MKTESYYRILLVIAFFVLSFLSAAITSKSQAMEVPSEATSTELMEDSAFN